MFGKGPFAGNWPGWSEAAGVQSNSRPDCTQHGRGTHAHLPDLLALFTFRGGRVEGLMDKGMAAPEVEGTSVSRKLPRQRKAYRLPETGSGPGEEQRARPVQGKRNRGRHRYRRRRGGEASALGKRR